MPLHCEMIEGWDTNYELSADFKSLAKAPYLELAIAIRESQALPAWIVAHCQYSHSVLRKRYPLFVEGDVGEWTRASVRKHVVHGNVRPAQA